MAAKNKLSKNQSQAADPAHNVWVQANAGTGKTSILVQRLLRILYRGNATCNSGILCLTYTNAGVSEMRNRILAALREWAYANNAALRDLLVDVAHDGPPTDADLTMARTIFYEYIDNPQMLKIRTIHGFCEEILRRFPIEAGIPVAWNLISGPDQKQLQRDAFTQLLNENGERSLSNAFSRVLEQTSEYRMDELLDILTGLCRDYFSITNNFNNREQFIDMSRYILNCGSMAKDDFYAPGNMVSRRKIPTLIFNEEKPAVYLKKIADIIGKFFPNDATRLTNNEFEEYKNAFLNNDGTKKQLVAKKCYLQGEQEIVYRLANENANNAIFENTVAMYDLADAFAEKYREMKMARGVLDFDDLIAKTVKLFANPGQMGWVLSQLDVNLKHILVDEAQDTSPLQWRIINALTADLETEGDTVEAQHSIFVVGDTKQSIYSFQGAEPKAFMESKKSVGDNIKNSVREIIYVPLEQSFRSTLPILSAVDCFFSAPEIARLSNFTNNTHICTRTGDAGLVALHPIKITDPESGETTAQTRHEYICEIADKIAGLIGTELESPFVNTMGGKIVGRPIEPSDIMVLLQRRPGFAATLIGELQRRGIDVAGSDRIILPEFPAIRDLLNVARFCIDDSNDYALACILKSPLFRLTEPELYELCHNRLGKNLFSRINELNPGIYIKLQQILNWKNLAPYSFFMTILNTDGRRRNMIAALGPQIIDPLEEFLTICLSYERTQPGKLSDFMEWFINGGAEIKRETNAANGVRIMTIHGSKGLDSPIVFLIDTAQSQKKDGRSPVAAEDIFLWRGDAPESAEFMAAAAAIEQKQLEEYYRLLYVAMTRARDRLYIYGYHNHKNPSENSWGPRLAAILPNHPDAKIDENTGVLTISCPQTRPITQVKTKSKGENKDVVPKRCETMIPEPKVSISPAVTDCKNKAGEKDQNHGAFIYPRTDTVPGSSVLCKAGTDIPRDETGIPAQSLSEFLAARESRKHATDVGTEIHRRLQRIVIASTTQGAAAANTDIGQGDAKLISQILAHPELLRFFTAAPDTELRTEVPIAGTINDRFISRRLDRIIISDKEIEFLDYKTDTDLSIRRDKYASQMNEYAALLSAVYPDRTVRGYILWIHDWVLEKFEDFN